MNKKQIVRRAICSSLAGLALLSSYELCRPATSVEKQKATLELQSNLSVDLFTPWKPYAMTSTCFVVSYKPETQPTNLDRIELWVGDKNLGSIPQGVEIAQYGQSCAGRTAKEAAAKAQHIIQDMLRAGENQVRSAWSPSVRKVGIENPDIRAWGECMERAGLTRDNGKCGSVFTPTQG